MKEKCNASMDDFIKLMARNALIWMGSGTRCAAAVVNCTDSVTRGAVRSEKANDVILH
jgi:hypothetical protein